MIKKLTYEPDDYFLKTFCGYLKIRKGGTVLDLNNRISLHVLYQWKRPNTTTKGGDLKSETMEGDLLLKKWIQYHAWTEVLVQYFHWS